MSEVDKKVLPTRLLWVDLEMTGLDASQDVIIEVAAEITDFEFNTLGGRPYAKKRVVAGLPRKPR